MAQYIDKSALVAEINRVLNSYDPNEITSGRYALVNLRNFIGTLEVKEVDLKKEIGFYIETSLTGTNPVYTKGAVSCIIEKTARHFFELGMQQSKNYNNNEE